MLILQVSLRFSSDHIQHVRAHLKHISCAGGFYIWHTHTHTHTHTEHEHNDQIQHAFISCTAMLDPVACCDDNSEPLGLSAA